ncbi:hypothetical protein SCHPADRAFT_165977 [Schizopora paradoxa]|uniref:Uncharacterized protein n=1 Tax=Schizopora paradoxa TaxID=27342 RepID=A0A0H2S6P9_9AGAM|nr:hypothetical protein SCHPADRAFT_165977 [Schizopora paradoxa]
MRAAHALRIGVQTLEILSVIPQRGQVYSYLRVAAQASRRRRCNTLRQWQLSLVGYLQYILSYFWVKPENRLKRSGQ